MSFLSLLDMREAPLTNHIVECTLFSGDMSQSLAHMRIINMSSRNYTEKFIHHSTKN